MSAENLTFEDYKLRTQIFIGSVSEVIGIKKNYGINERSK